ncbi:Protein kinase-like domain superfamily [Sesbania bispinosa]|nr:Protein kinase-like domain superfamily [Sesbania bispinosa]
MSWIVPRFLRRENIIPRWHIIKSEMIVKMRYVFQFQFRLNLEQRSDWNRWRRQKEVPMVLLFGVCFHANSDFGKYRWHKLASIVICRCTPNLNAAVKGGSHFGITEYMSDLAIWDFDCVLVMAGLRPSLAAVSISEFRNNSEIKTAAAGSNVSSHLKGIPRLIFLSIPTGLVFHRTSKLATTAASLRSFGVPHWCCNDDTKIILVYDFVQRGTLCEYLYHSDNQPLRWKQRLQILVGATSGLHDVIESTTRATTSLQHARFTLVVARSMQGMNWNPMIPPLLEILDYTLSQGRAWAISITPRKLLI